MLERCREKGILVNCWKDIIDSLFLEGQHGDELKGRKRNLFIHSTAHGHLGSFSFLAVVNKAAMDIKKKAEKGKQTKENWRVKRQF